MISAHNLILCYEGSDSPALKGINLVIKQGTVHLLLGKSGSGKTSLLHCLGGAITDYLGSVEIDGQFLKELKGSQRASLLGFVTQALHLFPHLTVLDNLMQPQVKVLGRKREVANARAKELMSQFGLLDLSHRFPHQLSGGQQQRVAILRVLAMDVALLLLDEPTSALDPKNRQQFQELIRDLKGRGLTIVLSTHDLTFCEGVADHIHYMEEGEIVHSIDLEHGSVDRDEILKLYESIGGTNGN